MLKDPLSEMFVDGGSWSDDKVTRSGAERNSANEILPRRQKQSWADDVETGCPFEILLTWV